MKRVLTAILILLIGLLPNYGEPTSSPTGEPIPMIFDKPQSQGGSTRTPFPSASAVHSNQMVTVQVTHYNGSIVTYIEDANGIIVAYTTGFATNGRYDTNLRIEHNNQDNYTLHVILDYCSYTGYFES